MTTDTIPPEQMGIADPDGFLRTYGFGTKKARHHFCGMCGIHTFVQTRLNPGHFRINLGCVEAIDVFGLPIDTYHGKAL